MKTFYLKILLLCMVIFLFNVTFAFAENAQKHYDAGISSLNLGKYDKAIKEFKTAMKLDSSYNCQCYYCIGVCYAFLENFKDAISAYQKSSSFTKDKSIIAQNYYEMGLCFEFMLDHDKAVDCYTKSYQAYPNAQSCYALGLAYSNMGKKDLAIKYYQEYINLEPDGPDAEYVLQAISELQSSSMANNNTNNYSSNGDTTDKAWECYNQGAYDDAILLFNKILLKEQNDVDAHLGLAYCYHDQGLYDNALEEYLEVCKLSPESFYANYYAGLIYFNQKQDDKNALARFSQALKSAPSDKDKASCHNYMGICYYNLKDYKNSIVNYENAVKYNSSEAVYYYNLGLAYYYSGNNKKAEDYFKKCIGLDKSGDYTADANNFIQQIHGGGNTTGSLSAEEHYNLGWKYYNEKKYDKAKEEFLKAIDLKPDYLDAYNDLGYVYLSIDKDYKKAAYYFQTTLELNPKYALGYYNIGAIYYNQERYKESIDKYKRYLELEPNGQYAKTAKESIAYMEDFLASSQPTPVPTKVSSNPTPVPTQQVSSKSAPVIDIIEPASLLGKKNLVLEETNPVVTTVRVVGIVSDDEQVKKVTVNGQPVELSIPSAKGLEVVSADLTYKYQFTVPVGLTMGKNEIKVQAWDASNNIGEAKVSINYNPEQKVANNTTNVAPIQKGEKWAVVIGIGNYQNKNINKLNYTVADAKAIHEFLISKAGFAPDHIKLLLNEDATAKNIKSALGTFLTRKAMKNDTVFIYYSGHGAPEPDPASTDGDGLSKYLVTYDADPEDLYSTAFPMEEIRKIFQKIEANKIVFFVDACYSGATGGRTFSKPGMKAGNVSEKFLDDLSSGEGRVVVTASSASEVSLEVAELGHGIFTYYLLKGLEGTADANSDKRVTIDEVYQYVYDNVLKESKNRGGNQHPMKKGETSGQFIIVNY